MWTKRTHWIVSRSVCAVLCRRGFPIALAVGLMCAGLVTGAERRSRLQQSSPAHTDPDATCDTSPADDHPKPSQRPQEGQPSTFHLEANGSLERSCARVPQDRTFRFPAVFSDSDAAFQRSNPRGTPAEPVLSIQHPCPP